MPPTFRCDWCQKTEIPHDRIWDDAVPVYVRGKTELWCKACVTVDAKQIGGLKRVKPGLARKSKRLDAAHD